MASRTLYPPIVNDYEPAFIAGDNASLKIYFKLTSLIGEGIRPTGTFYIHASVIRKDGVQVVNLTNNATRNVYRATGTILNLTPIQEGNNKYYVEILNDDLKSSVDYGDTTFNGWIPGWTYKVQLRISTVAYNGDGSDQEKWMQENSAYFSEWSTICFVKSIGSMSIQIFDLNTNTTPNTSSSEKFSGSIYSSIPEVDEDFNWCRIKLFDSNNALLEDSGKLFRNEVSESYFEYYYKIALEESATYKVNLSYETENGYFDDTNDYTFTYTNAGGASQNIIYLVTADTTGFTADHTHTLSEDTPTFLENSLETFSDTVASLTSIGNEEDEGRIALKLHADGANPSNYFRFVIRRSDSKNNFKTWTDILYINFEDPTPTPAQINAYEIIYDYTIESGVWYKYAILPIVDNTGDRGTANIMTNPVIRIFNYSFLLGEDGQQLKLEFDNVMGNYATRIVEGKTETIGSKYPFIGRGSNIQYQTFPVTGLITFLMDEENTFLKNGKKDIYGYDDVVSLYNNYNISRGIGQYDYTFEREFRKKVLEFLQNGKPKLFKSPTEGNIIIRITDVSLTPNQSLDRLIYSFSGTASEVDDNTMDNYLKYGFYYPGDYIVTTN
jgi:hypothetical protein